MADDPLRFINSVVNEFQKWEECGDESFIIRPSLFEITKNYYIHHGVKWRSVNPTKLNQNIFWRNFTNSLTINSEL